MLLRRYHEQEAPAVEPEPIAPAAEPDAAQVIEPIWWKGAPPEEEE